MMVKTAWDLLDSLFMLVDATVRHLLPDQVFWVIQYHSIRFAERVNMPISRLIQTSKKADLLVSAVRRSLSIILTQQF